MAKKSRYKPRCRVCLATLRADGSCPFDCDPSLARPCARVKTKPREPEKLLIITEHERKAYRQALREIDPSYGKDFNPWLRLK